VSIAGGKHHNRLVQVKPQSKSTERSELLDLNLPR